MNDEASSEPCPACGYDSLLPAVLVAELELPISYPSQNYLGANGRGTAGWHYRRLRADFAAALHSALAEQSVPPAPGKRRIWLKRIYKSPGKRPYDVANLIGGGKGIVDVLVNRGILKDDSSNWFEGIYQQAPGPADRILLRIYDIL